MPAPQIIRCRQINPRVFELTFDQPVIILEDEPSAGFTLRIGDFQPEITQRTHIELSTFRFRHDMPSGPQARVRISYTQLPRGPANCRGEGLASFVDTPCP